MQMTGYTPNHNMHQTSAWNLLRCTSKTTPDDIGMTEQHQYKSFCCLTQVLGQKLESVAPPVALTPDDTVSHAHRYLCVTTMLEHLLHIAW